MIVAHFIHRRLCLPTIHAVYAYRNNDARSRNNYCRVKAISTNIMRTLIYSCISLRRIFTVVCGLCASAYFSSISLAFTHSASQCQYCIVWGITSIAKQSTNNLKCMKNMFVTWKFMQATQHDMSDFKGKNYNAIVSDGGVWVYWTKIYSCNGYASSNYRIPEDESENTWKKFMKLSQYFTAGNEYSHRNTRRR